MRDVDRLRQVITRRRFIAWLESKPDRAVVGCPLCAQFCPLANYMSETTGKSVSIEGSEMTFGVEATKLPEWCADFVRSIDAYGTLGESNVTKEFCLSILHS